MHPTQELRNPCLVEIQLPKVGSRYNQTLRIFTHMPMEIDDPFEVFASGKRRRRELFDLLIRDTRRKVAIIVGGDNPGSAR